MIRCEGVTEGCSANGLTAFNGNARGGTGFWYKMARVVLHIRSQRGVCVKQCSETGGHGGEFHGKEQGAGAAR